MASANDSPEPSIRMWRLGGAKKLYRLLLPFCSISFLEEGLCSFFFPVFFNSFLFPPFFFIYFYPGDGPALMDVPSRLEAGEKKEKEYIFNFFKVLFSFHSCVYLLFILLLVACFVLSRFICNSAGLEKLPREIPISRSRSKPEF